MPRATWLQTNFNGGEWSPMTYGRADLQKYRNSLASCLNYIPTIQGGLTRRPGTRYIAAVKDSSKKVRLLRFEFSTTQAYILEFGDQYVRFYTNGGQLLNAGVPYEVSTPYLEADLAQISIAQSADVLYIAHPNYAPRKLVRNGATSWTLSVISFLDGPYLITNTTSTTLTLSATSGAVTCTASSTTGINGGTGFTASDVGRALRFKSGANWGWGTITAYTSSTQVTVTLVTSPSAATASTTWRLGVMSTANGYPAAVSFHEDRLVWGGYAQYPQRLDGSNSSDYENYAPSAQDGTVAANNAYSFSLNSNTVNAIRWIQSDEKGMIIGTSGGEWIVRASSLTEALSPTNIQAKQVTRFGSAAVSSVQVGKAVLFVQRNGRRVRELAYSFQVDGFQSPDISLVSEHIPGKGVVQLAVQQQPQSLIWAALSDGTLGCISYDRDQEVVGWARHAVGGNGVVESIAAIPSPDGTRDDLWLVVKRTINGSTKRYVELMTKQWEDGDTLEGAVFLDSSAEYSGVATTSVTGLTWLQGEVVSVLADGSVHPDCTVSAGGVITLNRAATRVQVGYGYNSEGKTMRIEAGGADGPAQGKLKRIHRVIMRFWQSVGMTLVGDNWTEEKSFRTSADPMDSPVGLYTGDKRWAWAGSYDVEGQVAWRQSQPLPSNVLMLSVQLETQDGG